MRYRTSRETACVLAEFEPAVLGPGGQLYRARACGAPARDGTTRWHGWIEFIPAGPQRPLTSPPETIQPSRAATEYWASGLTPVYLEGALARALAHRRRSRPPEPRARVAAPARRPATLPPSTFAAVLNPFARRSGREALLKRRLLALSYPHLVAIVRTYQLVPGDEAALQELSYLRLVEIIVAAARRRAAYLHPR